MEGCLIMSTLTTLHFICIFYTKNFQRSQYRQGEKGKKIFQKAFLPPEFQTGGKIGDMKHRIKQKSCFILDRLMI